MGLQGVLCPILEPKNYINSDKTGKRISYSKVSSYKCGKCSRGDECGFPKLLRNKFLFPSFAHTSDPPQISVTSLTCCPRKAYLKLLTDYYMDISGYLNTRLGSAIHKELESASDKSEVYTEWITPNGNKCTAYIDAINIENRELIDIKTTAYGGYKKNGTSSLNYEVQIQCYATMLKRRFGVFIEKLTLLYIGLGDKICYSANVEIKDATEFINKRTDILAEAMKTKKLPAAEPLEDWECGYCYWNLPCHMPGAETLLLNY